MLRIPLAAALTVVSLGLTACNGRPPAAAAQSASRLLAASVAGDRVAFEAEIDRQAVRDDLRRQMVELGQRNGVQVDGGPSDFVLDRMIGPDALRRTISTTPTAAEILPRLKMIGRKRVCLPDAANADHCALTFAKARNHWRLVGMQAANPTPHLDGA